eukprot:Lankesteria_metandrocarpae@DN4504_c0_g1_i2.p1
MSIIRFVAIFTSEKISDLQGYTSKKCAAEGVPQEIVAIRHRIAHEEMPTLHQLRHTARLCVSYLMNSYWLPRVAHFAWRYKSPVWHFGVMDGLCVLLRDVMRLNYPRLAICIGHGQQRRQHRSLSMKSNSCSKVVTDSDKHNPSNNTSTANGYRDENVIKLDDCLDMLTPCDVLFARCVIKKTTKTLEEACWFEEFSALHDENKEIQNAILQWQLMTVEKLPRILYCLGDLLVSSPSEELTLSFLSNFLLLSLAPQSSPCFVVAVFVICARSTCNFMTRLVFDLLKTFFCFLGDEDSSTHQTRSNVVAMFDLWASALRIPHPRRAALVDLLQNGSLSICRRIIHWIGTFLLLSSMSSEHIHQSTTAAAMSTTSSPPEESGHRNHSRKNRYSHNSRTGHTTVTDIAKASPNVDLQDRYSAVDVPDTGDSADTGTAVSAETESCQLPVVLELCLTLLPVLNVNIPWSPTASLRMENSYYSTTSTGAVNPNISVRNNHVSTPARSVSSVGCHQHNSSRSFKPNDSCSSVDDRSSHLRRAAGTPSPVISSSAFISSHTHVNENNISSHRNRYNSSNYSCKPSSCRGAPSNSYPSTAGSRGRDIAADTSSSSTSGGVWPLQSLRDHSLLHFLAIVRARTVGVLRAATNITCARLLRITLCRAAGAGVITAVTSNAKNRDDNSGSNSSGSSATCGSAMSVGHSHVDPLEVELLHDLAILFSSVRRVSTAAWMQQFGTSLRLLAQLKLATAGPVLEAPKVKEYSPDVNETSPRLPVLVEECDSCGGLLRVGEGLWMLPADDLPWTLPGTLCDQPTLTLTEHIPSMLQSASNDSSFSRASRPPSVSEWLTKYINRESLKHDSIEPRTTNTGEGHEQQTTNASRKRNLSAVHPVDVDGGSNGSPPVQPQHLVLNGSGLRASYHAAGEGADAGDCQPVYTEHLHYSGGSTVASESCRSTALLRQHSCGGVVDGQQEVVLRDTSHTEAVLRAAVKRRRTQQYQAAALEDEEGLNSSDSAGSEDSATVADSCEEECTALSISTTGRLLMDCGGVPTMAPFVVVPAALKHLGCSQPGLELIQVQRNLCYVNQ